MVSLSSPPIVEIWSRYKYVWIVNSQAFLDWTPIWSGSGSGEGRRPEEDVVPWKTRTNRREPKWVAATDDGPQPIAFEDIEEQELEWYAEIVDTIAAGQRLDKPQEVEPIASFRLWRGRR
jgi:hypothetical protein